MAAPRDLLRAMLTFGGMLRASGLQVTTSALMDAVRALEAVDLMDRAEVYLTLQTVLMSRIEEQPAFDRCFDVVRLPWKRRCGRSSVCSFREVVCGSDRNRSSGVTAGR